ncbi:MAG: hypothetical protein R6V50_07850, partial [Thermoplasmatota archaeon]
VFVSAESLLIESMGQVGFKGKSNQSTARSTVHLELDYNSSATVCSCNNYNGTNATNYTWQRYYWSGWDDCSNIGYWVINTTMPENKTSEEKYVRCIINHTNDVAILVNDSITYSPLGEGLDTTPPSDFELIGLGNYVSLKNDTLIDFNWTISEDFESDYLGIPIIYSFRILYDNVSVTDWVALGTQNFVKRKVGDIIVNDSFSFIHEDAVTFQVRAENSAGLFTIVEKNLTLDLEDPVILGIDSSSIDSNSWYSSKKDSLDDMFFNWTGEDYLSGIYCYSFGFYMNSSKSPDDVCEGPIGNFDLKTNHFYENPDLVLQEGINYFTIKAIDNAGNIGNLSRFPVRIDSKSPSTPLLYDQGLLLNKSLDEKQGIIFNWTTSDSGCGISNHYVDVDDDIRFGSPEFSGFTNSSSTYFNFSSFKDGIYYIRVKAIDCVGHESVFSDVTKTVKQASPLMIYDYGPGGDVMTDEPYLYVETSKDAKCYYRSMGDSNYTKFDYTDGVFHQQNLDLDYATYSFDIFCNDSISNFKNFNIDFTSREFFEISSVSVSSNYSFFPGQKVEIIVKLSPFVSQLPKDMFELYLDGSLMNDFVVSEKDGFYKLIFEAPFVSASKDTELYLVIDDSKSNEIDIEFLAPELEINFDSEFVRSSERIISDYENIIYFKAENFSFGLSSLGENDIDENYFTLKSPIKNEAYIFFTTDTFHHSRREDVLLYSSFNNLVNPSFGFTVEDSNDYKLILSHDDSFLTSDYKFGTGNKILQFKNLGKTKDGRRKVHISSSKIQNISSEGVLIG